MKKWVPYNLLFYKAYQEAQHSGNWADMFALAGVSSVAFNLMLNLGAVLFMLERRLNWDASAWTRPAYKWYYVGVLVLLVAAWYLPGKRASKLVEEYDHYTWVRKTPPVVVILGFPVLSFGLLLLAGVYRHHG